MSMVVMIQPQAAAMMIAGSSSERSQQQTEPTQAAADVVGAAGVETTTGMRMDIDGVESGEAFAAKQPRIILLLLFFHQTITHTPVCAAAHAYAAQRELCIYDTVWLLLAAALLVTRTGAAPRNRCRQSRPRSHSSGRRGRRHPWQPVPPAAASVSPAPEMMEAFAQHMRVQ